MNNKLNFEKINNDDVNREIEDFTSIRNNVLMLVSLKERMDLWVRENVEKDDGSGSSNKPNSYQIFFHKKNFQKLCYIITDMKKITDTSIEITGIEKQSYNEYCNIFQSIFDHIKLQKPHKDGQIEKIGNIGNIINSTTNKNIYDFQDMKDLHVDTLKTAGLRVMYNLMCDTQRLFNLVNKKNETDPDKVKLNEKQIDVFKSNLKLMSGIKEAQPIIETPEFDKFLNNCEMLVASHKSKSFENE